METNSEYVAHLAGRDDLELLLPQASDRDERIRLYVAQAIPNCVAVERVAVTHPAVVALMRLARDENAQVRDWATFGLANLDVDGAEIRQCLFARADDSHADTRAEAIAGLARRHAPGSIELVDAALRSECVGRLTVEAAAQLGDPRLADALARLESWWDVDTELLEIAQRRCDPSRFDVCVDQIERLLDAAERRGVTVAVVDDLIEDFEVGAQAAFISGGENYWWSLSALFEKANDSAEVAIDLMFNRRD